MQADDYKVELEVFEGPLDLLLYLIRRDEVDIYDIPIERITTQYMEYLGVMRMLDLNIAGEFIVMAATLMMIKSRLLLPVEEREGLAEEDEEGEDPRWELVRQLVEYKKFKDAAAHLQEFELIQENAFLPGGGGAVLDTPDQGLPLQDVSIFDLISAFNEVLKRATEEKLGEIFAEQFTVAEKIEFILGRVAGGRTLRFSGLFSRMTSRHEIVCTFLALLELIRLRQVAARQDGVFGEIVIAPAEPEPEPDPGVDEEEEPVTAEPLAPPPTGAATPAGEAEADSDAMDADDSAEEEDEDSDDDEDGDEDEGDDWDEEDDEDMAGWSDADLEDDDEAEEDGAPRGGDAG
jgi:segregation and condensation protein A